MTSQYHPPLPLGIPHSLACCPWAASSLADKMERCPNLNSAHTQTNLLAHQQNVDSRALGAQSGDSSAFVFRCENAPSDSFLPNHPVSHKARTLKPIAEARTIEARASHIDPSSFRNLSRKTKSCEFGSKYFAVTFYFLTNEFMKVTGFQPLILLL
jgi:hypothetical protein